MNREKRQAIDELFQVTQVETFPLVLRREGSASRKDVFLNGQIRLEWRNDQSIAIPVPRGQHTLHFVVTGRTGDTFGFAMISPQAQALGAGSLSALGGQVFDRGINIP